MKNLLIIFFVLLCNGAFAQNALADLKFEEVETAFNNSDYKTVLTKLDEFDKLWGSVTSKSLYLRIVSENQLLKDKLTPFSVLGSLRKHTSLYLEVMENEGLDEKLREVYKISEELKQYPSDEASWKVRKEEKEKAERDLASKIENWNFEEGVKIGDNINNLIGKYNLYTNDNGENKVWYNRGLTSDLDLKGYDKITTKNLYVTQYEYIIKRNQVKEIAIDEQKKVIEKFKTIFSNATISEYEKNSYTNYKISSPYTKTIILLTLDRGWECFEMKFVKSIYSE